MSAKWSRRMSRIRWIQKSKQLHRPPPRCTGIATHLATMAISISTRTHRRATKTSASTSSTRRANTNRVSSRITRMRMATSQRVFMARIVWATTEVTAHKAKRRVTPPLHSNKTTWCNRISKWTYSTIRNVHMSCHLWIICQLTIRVSRVLWSPTGRSAVWFYKMLWRGRMLKPTSRLLPRASKSATSNTRQLNITIKLTSIVWIIANWPRWMFRRVMQVSVISSSRLKVLSNLLLARTW